jgi:MerR family transcriptional regulator, light-induced transcriptional regulator
LELSGYPGAVEENLYFMSRSSTGELSIGDVVRATGVGEAALRAWERRFGFPAPRREPSGHRRYTAEDVEQIRRVLVERGRGLALPAAIERASEAPTPVRSMFARLRASRPDLQTVTVKKRHLTELTRAVEDESCARAEAPVLLGSFQRARYYRQSEPRWRELARGAAGCAVMADFERLRSPRGAPVEVPVERAHPVLREWALICDAPEHGACVLAWELPPRRRAPDDEREFELLLSVEPTVVRAVAEAALDVAGSAAPELAARLRSLLSEGPPPTTAGQLRLATGITARLVGRLA